VQRDLLWSPEKGLSQTSSPNAPSEVTTANAAMANVRIVEIKTGLSLVVEGAWRLPSC
jgi:hypothetical protein